MPTNHKKTKGERGVYKNKMQKYAEDLAFELISDIDKTDSPRIDIQAEVKDKRDRYMFYARLIKLPNSKKK